MPREKKKPDRVGVNSPFRTLVLNDSRECPGLQPLLLSLWFIIINLNVQQNVNSSLLWSLREEREICIPF